MITTLKGDITGLDFTIIVNAANKHLLPGSGVCGAIFSKAGKGLEEECQQLHGCPTGDAKMTKAYGLRCDRIIHAVGPIYLDGNHQERELLESCYWNSLCLAYSYVREQNLEKCTLAFPCISTGIYGFPREEACQIAVKTVKTLMRQYPDAKVIDVIFVCYLQEDYALYKEELKKYEIYG
ncbi:MAG: macro domain-containing protein [Holdemanella sp.]|nr:macro domain-containing protein [Holdemanella sp.]